MYITIIHDGKVRRAIADESGIRIYDRHPRLATASAADRRYLPRGKVVSFADENYHAPVDSVEVIGSPFTGENWPADVLAIPRIARMILRESQSVGSPLIGSIDQLSDEVVVQIAAGRDWCDVTSRLRAAAEAI